jgi:hypothetical protein
VKNGVEEKFNYKVKNSNLSLIKNLEDNKNPPLVINYSFDNENRLILKDKTNTYQYQLSDSTADN